MKLLCDQKVHLIIIFYNVTVNDLASRTQVDVEHLLSERWKIYIHMKCVITNNDFSVKSVPLLRFKCVNLYFVYFTSVFDCLRTFAGENTKWVSLAHPSYLSREKFISWLLLEIVTGQQSVAKDAPSPHPSTLGSCHRSEEKLWRTPGRSSQILNNSEQHYHIVQFLKLYTILWR